MTSEEALAQAIMAASELCDIPNRAGLVTIAETKHILATLAAMGFVVARHADVAESLMERDVWDALDAAVDGTKPSR